MIGAVTAGIEIERKFLVTELPPEPGRHPHGEIQQGYLALDEDGAEVRVRRYDGTTTLTVKSGGTRLRVEEDIAIDARTFESLWPLTEGRRIEKTRYRVPAPHDLVVEVDVYHGRLEGLVVAEVEFGSLEGASAFTPLAWLGREVTEDPRYKNRQLATSDAPAETGRGT